MNKKLLAVYAITDSRYSSSEEEFFIQIESALKGGITLLQLREKNLSYDKFLERAVKVKKICSKYNVPLIINDNVKIALESGADGVHLGQDDGSIEEARKILGDDKIIGVTAKTSEQAVNAEKSGADYLGSGAVFTSVAKPEAMRITPETLKCIADSVNIPVCAIGGVTAENLPSLRGTGISGAAVISAVFDNEDIEAAALKLRKISEECFYG